jgi:MFS transporter, ACS family, tartrate transporter
VINSVGNLGGFAGPFAIGYIKGAGKSATPGLLFLSALLVVAFVMTLLIRINGQRDDDRAPSVARQSS